MWNRRFTRKGSAAAVAVLALVVIGIFVALGYFISSTGEEMAEVGKQQSQRMRAARDMQRQATEINRLQQEQMHRVERGEEGSPEFALRERQIEQARQRMQQIVRQHLEAEAR